MATALESGPLVAGRRIEVRGIVQGVGFRPWVYRLAHEEGIRGRVRNDGAGVTIEAFGSPSALSRFVKRIGEEAPPAARVLELRERGIGAEPVYVPATAATNHLPDFAALSRDLLARTLIVYICSPANPQGTIADLAYWRTLISLAREHHFLVFADECYAEIYDREAPTGILEAAAETG